MAKVIIDNVEYEVPDGKNMLEVCLSLGMDLTYFCWHPAMHSVGACRQCAVIQYRDENDTRGKIVMSCMVDAVNGTRISLQDQKGKDFRAGNIESLMLNHPHDCPVCDEGGECHLQDMTVMSGHNYRRYRFNKRTHVNQDLGPFVYHEMNRCIQCYRCVRFYNDYAGGKDFGVFASSGRVYFGRSESGTLENEFSGNLVEICPTGVFTDKTLRKHYTRKWDLTSAPSICHQCSVGCNTLASERYGGLRRILSRYNGDVNGYFLCDRGRFGYEYVNDDKRLTKVAQKATSDTDAFASVKNLVGSKPRMIGIGSPRASLESNFMLKQLVGEENFYQGIPQHEAQLAETAFNLLRTVGVKTPSLSEIETYDAVLVLGEDVTNTAPMIALALRQAAKNQPREEAYKLKIQKWNDAAIREVVQDRTGPFYTATPCSTKLDEIATQKFTGDTNHLLALSDKIIAAIAGSQGGNDNTDAYANDVAKALLSCKKPLVVSGTGMMSKEILLAAAGIARALKVSGKEAGLTFAVPEVNSMGLALIGGKYWDEAVARVQSEKDTIAIVMETNLAYRFGKKNAESFLKNCKQVVMIDSLENETTAFADFILPAGTFAESTGTVINNEGRAQRFYEVFVPKNEIRSSWAWIDQLTHSKESARHFDTIVEEMIAHYPILEKIRDLAPDANSRIGTQKIPRETHRYSGRTAMNANISVHEPKPPVDEDSPLTYTMEGYHGKAPSKAIPYFWSPGWNSLQSINKYQIEVGGPLHGGNPGIRLIEAGDNTGGDLKNTGSNKTNNGTFEVLPSHHIFGGDELSAKSAPLATRIPDTTVSISSSALQRSGIEGAESLSINYDGEAHSFKIKIDNSLPDNVLMLPKGFNETKGLLFPFFTEISKG